MSSHEADCGQTDRYLWLVIILKSVTVELNGKKNSYYFSRANQQKASTKIYSLTQCSLTVNEYDWHILAGNDERIDSLCLTHLQLVRRIEL